MNGNNIIYFIYVVLNFNFVYMIAKHFQKVKKRSNPKSTLFAMNFQYYRNKKLLRVNTIIIKIMLYDIYKYIYILRNKQKTIILYTCTHRHFIKNKTII